MGDCITTYTGKHFDPTHPDEELICIEDIAHALSLLCRGNGHVRTFFSVGQHCICLLYTSAISVRIANGYASGNACLAANDIFKYIFGLADESTILTGYAASDTSNVSND